jgi:hypothetical protein
MDACGCLVVDPFAVLVWVAEGCRGGLGLRLCPRVASWPRMVCAMDRELQQCDEAMQARRIVWGFVDEVSLAGVAGSLVLARLAGAVRRSGNTRGAAAGAAVRRPARARHEGRMWFCQASTPMEEGHPVGAWRCWHFGAVGPFLGGVHQYLSISLPGPLAVSTSSQDSGASVGVEWAWGICACSCTGSAARLQCIPAAAAAAPIRRPAARAAAGASARSCRPGHDCRGGRRAARTQPDNSKARLPVGRAVARAARRLPSKQGGRGGRKLYQQTWLPRAPSMHRTRRGMGRPSFLSLRGRKKGEWGVGRGGTARRAFVSGEGAVRRRRRRRLP